LYASAIEYFNRALELYKSTPEQNRRNPKIDQPPWVLLNIGNIYLKNGDYEKASEKYNEAKNTFLSMDFKKNAVFGVNTSESNLGLIDQIKGDFNAAEEKYFQVYQRRIKSEKHDDILYSLAQLIAIDLLKGDVISAENKLNKLDQYYTIHKEKFNSTSIFTRNYGYGITSFAAYYQSKKKFDSAIRFLKKSEKILIGFPTEVAALGSRFAECYLGAGEFDKAEQRALKNLEIKNLSDAEKKYNYKVLEKVYNKKNLNSKLLNIKDSLIILTSGSSNSKIFSVLNSLETKIQLAKSAREINENKIRYNTYLYVLIICTVILFFSLITIRINYNYQKERSKSLSLEKINIQNQLDKKNRELFSKSNFIIQRNDYLKKIKKKLEQPSQEKTNFSRLSKELNMIIASEKSYHDFDNMFIEVYPNFYKSLNQIAKLSKTDLRLSSYIKMNHSNDEIAKISGVSIRTIESQRYRLSKKLNLDIGQDLNSFIHNI
jgi:DNA-binding CsgD family transcriptional regulator